MNKKPTDHNGMSAPWTTITSYARMLFHRNTPWTVKAVLAVAIAYLLSPFDLVPDWLMGLGIIDDLAIVSLLVAWAIRRIHPQHAGDSTPE